MQTIQPSSRTETESRCDAHQPGSGAGVLVEARDSESCPVKDGCPNCGTQPYSSSTWCKYCGYYKLLGRCVDIADWERDYENGEYVGQKEEPPAVWLGIPICAWLLTLALICVTGVSLAGHYLTIAGTTPRLTWSLCQVASGLVAFFGAHFRISYVALARNKSLQLADVFMSPVRIWMGPDMDFQQLSRWLAIGVTGIWATILAHVLLGVPYSRLFKGENSPTKPDARSGAAAGTAAASGDKEMTMEEAMEELNERSGAEQAANGAKSSSSRQGGLLPNASDESEKVPDIKELECLIVGYSPGANGGDSIRSIVVAIQSNGRWSVIGTVSNGLTPEIQRDLSSSAKSLHRERPFVECSYSAVWLEPVLRCRIEAEYPPGESKPKNMKVVGLK